MSGRLDDKVAVITGTAGGMGKAAGGEMISVHPCDLTDPEQVKRLIDTAVESYGGLDVLYNNAAMAYFAWVQDFTYETWNATIQQELDVVFRACLEAWPHLIARGGGSIINTGSASGKGVYDVLPGLAHSAAKGGVIAMTRQLAMEGGEHNIRANTISPGTIRTAQTEAFLGDEHWYEAQMRRLMLKRIGEPEDVAPCAVFLASEESAWVTGADFAVDGGTAAW